MSETPADPGPRRTGEPSDGAPPLDAAEQDPAPTPEEGSSGYSTSAPAYGGAGDQADGDADQGEDADRGA